MSLSVQEMPERLYLQSTYDFSIVCFFNALLFLYYSETKQYRNAMLKVEIILCVKWEIAHQLTH